MNGTARLRTFHVTGHLLGGSYFSFCYAQMLIDATQRKLSQLLDPDGRYTCVAPRVSCQAWTKMNSTVVSHDNGEIMKDQEQSGSHTAGSDNVSEAKQLDFLSRGE